MYMYMLQCINILSLKAGQNLKVRICSYRSKLFSLIVDPIMGEPEKHIK